MLLRLTFLIIVLLHIVPLNALAELLTVSHRIETEVTEALPSNTRWAVKVVDAESGKVLVDAGNAGGKGLSPASLAKLFSTAAFLDSLKLGSPVLETVIAHDGEMKAGIIEGSLYIRGGGNALLTTDDLGKAVAELTERGIREIKGDIIADESLFDPSGIKRKRTGPAYAVPSALGLDLHTVAITVMPKEGGEEPEVEIEPPNSDVKVSFGEGRAGIRQIDDLTYEVIGRVKGTIKRRFALSEPGLYAAGTLKTLLEEAGKKVEGKVRKGVAPESASELARIKPPPVEEMLRDINFNSLNVMADNLFLLAGAMRYGPSGTVEKGRRSVDEMLEGKSLGGELVDGSGLGDGNRVTTDTVIGLLRIARKKLWFETFYNSLPRPGLDGTLKRYRFRSDKFRAKSGQLRDVYGLAGYGVMKDGREIIYCYIVNVPGADMMGVERTGSEILEILSGS